MSHIHARNSQTLGISQTQSVISVVGRCKCLPVSSTKVTNTSNNSMEMYRLLKSIEFAHLYHIAKTVQFGGEYSEIVIVPNIPKI